MAGDLEEDAEMEMDVAAPARTGKWTPGTFQLRDAWFPVAHLADVSARPLRRMVHSRSFYVSRASERLVTVSEDATVPTVARYGFAWIWYGDPDAADPALIPDIPFLPRDRLQPAYSRDTNFFHCTYELVLENILDLTHIDYVHRNFSGPEESTEDTVRFESTSETVTMIRTIKGKQTSDYQRDVLGITDPLQDQTAFTHVFIRSGVCFLHSHYSSAPSMPLMQTNTPESRFQTRASVVFGVQQCSAPAYRRAWPRTGPIVAAQDEAMLDPQNERYLFAPNRADLSTRFDAAGLHFRKRYNDLVERQRAGDHAYRPDYFDANDVGEVLKVKRV
jgi:phenylpropionate dioxygenase-like ring-hydroxylating dioxygenase large terminal subunit